MQLAVPTSDDENDQPAKFKLDDNIFNAVVIITEDLMISCDGESSDLVAAHDEGEKSDVCNAAVTDNGSGLALVESTICVEVEGDKTQSAEFDQLFVTSGERPDSTECNEVVIDHNDVMDTVLSHECSETSSIDTDRFSTVVCPPDSLGSSESAGETADDGQQAAVASTAVNFLGSSDAEYVRTLQSLITQLKSAVSSAQSGNRVLCVLYSSW